MSFLAINWDVSPELLSLGPIHIRYYGLMFVIAFLLAFYFFSKIFKREGLPVDPLLYNLTFNVFIFMLIGARLGHCLLYNPSYYFAHPIEFLKVWEGGLASHGAAVGILIGLIWFSYKHKMSVIWLLDRIGIVVPIAGACVRIGNLMNSEIFGYPTTLPWGFKFLRSEEWYEKCNSLPCHPTQLYEALAYILIFVLLWWVYRKFLKTLRPGLLFGLFLILLFSARFFIEFLKLPQEGEAESFLDKGQLFSIPFIILGIGFLVYAYFHKTPALPMKKGIDTKNKKK